MRGECKPLEFKFRKFHNKIIKRRLKKCEIKHFFLYKGQVGLKTVKSKVITSIQLKTILKGLSRSIKKREGKIFLFCFPNIALTGKSVSVRMGAGIGDIIEWIYIVKKNSILLELDCYDSNKLLNAILFCKQKIPMDIFLVKTTLGRKYLTFK